MPNWLTIDELKKLGVTVYGKNVLVSTFVNIYNPVNLILHDNIRIDDFTTISCKGKVEIFNHVHIGPQCMISSSTNIIFGNYSGISSGVKLFGGCDDFSGKYLTNPTVPTKYLNVQIGDIILEDHVLIGSTSIVLPNVILKEGTCIGALSLVKKNTESWKMYAGSPIKLLKNRSKECLLLQNELENEQNQQNEQNELENEQNQQNELENEQNQQNELENDNKTIFITGGSRGIGKSIALFFNNLDYNVVITYNNSIDEAKKLEKNGISVYKMNVINNLECKNVIQDVINKFKKIDILINNAGILDNQLFHEMELDTWNNVINTNINSIYNVTYYIIQNMIENKYGKIINISSVYGIKGSKGQTNYSTSKHGVIGFTKSLALECGNKNIQVNCICPGLVNTDMLKTINKNVVDKIIQSNPIRKIIEPNEIAKACDFFINSDYCTGSILSIDCGMNC
jgi:3-oxoacyl-[acyl-carrier protein] reductase